MPKWNGGVIGVANNPTQSSAKGIWSLSEATKAIRAGLWPPSNAGADPYFENVTLLLPGDGTNGAQNNTFLDSSTNNFTITRNGNTTQGTFTPFSKVDGRWSNYFDGSGDYLTVSNSNLAPGTGDFTIEMWVYATVTPTDDGIFESRSNGTGTAGFTIGAFDGTTIRIFCGSALITASSVSYINTWCHLAVVKSSGTTTFYVNGVSKGTTTSIGNQTDTSWAIGGGRYGGTTTPDAVFSGYISGFRYVKGTAVYTANFTPPTAPLTAITNTSLLTCQSNRFIDNSTNAFAITRNGDVSVQTFSPFPTLTAYAAGTNGGSGYFDNSGDYLTVGSNAAYRIESNSTWTFECWMYPLSLSAGDVIASNTTNGASTGHNILLINGVPRVVQYGNAAFDSTATLRVGQWTHLAIVSNSNALTFYVNGTASGTATWGSGSAGGTLYIGAGYTGSDNFDGYISGMRYVVGSTQVPSAGGPTAPPTAVTNTALLLNFTNGGIIDTSMSNDLETVGNAQISTTQSKFGGGSMYFDGTGDYLDARLGPVQVLGGDFTVEMWVYPTTITGSNRTFLFLENGVNSAAFFMYGATGYVGLDINNVATYNLGSTAITTNSWQHLAFVRSGSTLTAYINGTSVGTATVTASLGSSGVMRIGAGASAGAPYFGYFDEMRVTKGYARYTTNFTAPISPFNGFGD